MGNSAQPSRVDPCGDAVVPGAVAVAPLEAATPFVLDHRHPGTLDQLALLLEHADAQGVPRPELDRQVVGRLQAAERLGLDAIGLAGAKILGDHRQAVEVARRSGR